MAYTGGFTAVTGATFTAAQYNTNVRDNFSAVWAYTTVGDIVYADSTSTLTRLGIGSAGQALKVASGATSLEWGGVAPKIGNVTDLTVYTWVGGGGAGSWEDITNMTVSVELDATSTVAMIVAGSISSVDAAGGVSVRGSIAGTDDDSTSGGYSITKLTIGGATYPYAYVYVTTGVAATTDCECKMQITNVLNNDAKHNTGRIMVLAWEE